MSSECCSEEVVALTGELVRIPSENPTGTEKEIGEYVFQWLARAGLETWKEPVAGERFNVIARLPGTSKDAPALAWLAHLDTVPAGEGWTRDPFGAEIVDGRLYGRGSADMKGGLAAAMVALKQLASEGFRPVGDLLLIATVDEEGPDMIGAMDVYKKGMVRRDSYLVAVEPSDLKILAGHKGPLWYRLEVKGKMAHAGMPWHGVDAIHGMSACLLRLKELVQSLPYDDELLGPATVNIGRIQGGVKTNIVPAFCYAEVDLRATYPMTVEEADALIARALQEGVAQVPGATAGWQRLGLKRPPQKIPAGSPLLQSFQSAAQAVLGRAETAGFPAYTDAAIIASLVGSPHCLTFGPGNLSQAHAVDEYVEVEQLPLAARVLAQAARLLLSP
ncbi:MAG TPA: M20 family metallopeptidase [Clostridia bacterium]|nr:M20 family metallopeptidase [Clostridia bacterium]